MNKDPRTVRGRQTMTKKKTTAATRPTYDWRKDLQGATPDKLARALLRKVGNVK